MLRRLSFTARIFIATAILVVVALGVAAAATYIRGSRIASAAANDSLQHSRAVQQSFQTLHFQRLELMSQLVATDPAFLSYVVEAGGNNFTGNSQQGSRSIANLLNERQTEVGFDLGMVLDPSGMPIAQTSGSTPINGSLATDALVSAAMQSRQGQTGYWLRNAKLYEVAVAPLGNSDQLAGYLVLGLAVNQAQLQSIKEVSNSDLVIMDTSTGRYLPVVDTLKPQELTNLQRALAALPSLPKGVFALRLGGERWLASARSLNSSGDAGVAVTLTSFDQAMGGFRSILNTQLGAAILAILLALALSWWLSRQVAKPLRKLAQAAQAAARGEYQGHFQAPKGGGEIAQVTQAFDSLLSDLREKSEMEIYMADLAKYQPEAVAVKTPDLTGNPAGSTTQDLSGAFLALRLHGALHYSGSMPDKALLAFNARLRNIEIPARRQGGRLITAAADRVFFAFDNFANALIAATNILNEANKGNDKVSVAVALGRVVIGAAHWSTGGGTTLLGEPIRQLENWLPDAPVGTLLAQAELATAVQNQIGARALAPTGTLKERGLIALDMSLVSLSPGRSGNTNRDGSSLTPGGSPRAARPTLISGTVLADRYEVLSELGSGGMAMVYKARDRQLDEVVALKTLKSDNAQDEQQLEVVKNEIRLLRKVTHRNVLRIYDFGYADGIPFISMEYVRGMTLKYLLQNRTRLPYAAGLRIMRQMCAALEIAHAEGVLHQDIKPENVMLEPNGNAKLMDFGIASPIKRDDRSAADVVIMGTPAYASPEQLQGAPMDERTDIYACGVMMYKMFSGKLPFDERQLNVLLALKLKEQFKPLSVLVKDFPASIEALISSCLKADPEERPESATALLQSLESIRV
ncbi:MAG: protein kinase domain-containing protein [Gammaproteobacteria bacterium]